MRWRRSPLRNRVELAAYRLAKGTLGRAGPGLTEPVGALLGELFHTIPGRRRQILEFNLALAYPEMAAAERRRLGRAVARHFGRGMLATLRTQRMQPGDLLRQVEVIGWEEVERLQSEGRGLLVLTAHIGAWEVAALVIGLLSRARFSVIHRPLDNPLLDAELESFRRRFGNHALPKRGVTRPMLAAIRAGESVGLLIDQRAQAHDGIDVPFFGHPARTHTGLARIVLRTGTPVVPIWCLAAPGGHYRLTFDPPVAIAADDTVESLTTRFSAVTEAAIRARPEQWLWYHDRWRELRLAAAR
jgi:KDO2-lipid IV(A) lauroyltransferase